MTLAARSQVKRTMTCHQAAQFRNGCSSRFATVEWGTGQVPTTSVGACRCFCLAAPIRPIQAPARVARRGPRPTLPSRRHLASTFAYGWRTRVRICDLFVWRPELYLAPGSRAIDGVYAVFSLRPRVVALCWANPCHSSAARKQRVGVRHKSSCRASPSLSSSLNSPPDFFTCPRCFPLQSSPLRIIPRRLRCSARSLLTCITKSSPRKCAAGQPMMAPSSRILLVRSYSLVAMTESDTAATAAHMTDAEVEEDVRQFAENHLRSVQYETILRAARVAKDKRIYDEVAARPRFDVRGRLPVHLTKQEKDALRREKNVTFSEKGMRIVIATVSLAALLQGGLHSPCHHPGRASNLAFPRLRPVFLQRGVSVCGPMGPRIIGKRRCVASWGCQLVAVVLRRLGRLSSLAAHQLLVRKKRRDNHGSPPGPFKLDWRCVRNQLGAATLRQDRQRSRFVRARFLGLGVLINDHG